MTLPLGRRTKRSDGRSTPGPGGIGRNAASEEE